MKDGLYEDDDIFETLPTAVRLHCLQLYKYVFTFTDDTSILIVIAVVSSKPSVAALGEL